MNLNSKNEIMTPLAERVRPQRLEDYFGQKHLLADGKILKKTIESGNIHSMIFWGPPGCGKTTLAHIISKTLDRSFFSLSAISSGVADIRNVIEKVQKSDLFQKGRTILFIDEIHRFSKSQQDSLLQSVEKGVITLIGATTENPSFEVISPLLSRCQVYILKPLEEPEIIQIIENARKKDTWLQKQSFEITEYQALLRLGDGDARKVLNNLEILIQLLSDNSLEKKDITIDNRVVTESFEKNFALFDKDGEQHYNIISAFIKSIRGSDPNAALYWLARMVAGGEKPEFIARRLVILASEDIGNANPMALSLASSCFQMVHAVGWPESRIILAQCVIYLATSPKSNSSYTAISNAEKLVQESGNLPVPLHLRNAPTSLMKNIGYGKNYKYAHDYENNFINQEFMPDKLSGTILYIPGKNTKENQIFEFIKEKWKEHYPYE